MAISNQFVHRINIVKLKSIKDLEMSFDGHNVTGILGPNGNGKSTILHALACAFQPLSGGDNIKFSNFFLPHPDALWQGSELSVIHSYQDGATRYDCIKQDYQKNADRWSPKYVRRPFRNIYYIGIDKCVPLIESEKRQVRVNYSTRTLSEDIILKILSKASIILNRSYSTYNIHDAGQGNTFIGVEVDGVRYSALSMSAGEQKVFLILEKVFKAEKYSLILIDEVDLLLHDVALKKLIIVISERAKDKSLQIIFTTHRESIIDLDDIINIRHMFNTPTKTLCFNETKPDAINRLNGSQLKPIEVFVEDDLAESIVEKICSQLKLSKYVSIGKYGAAINCFTIVSGLLLRGHYCDNSIFVLDGDVYSSDNEKSARICHVLTGNDADAIMNRSKALDKIKQFNLPENIKPEKFIHGIVIDSETNIDQEKDEIIEVAREIIVRDDDHKYVDDIITRLGWKRSKGLAKIIDLISESDKWPVYVEDIKNWLSSKISEVRETN